MNRYFLETAIDALNAFKAFVEAEDPQEQLAASGPVQSLCNKAGELPPVPQPPHIV